ncbi:MAG: DNA polymerase III subunit beta [Cyanobacteria bacterium]|nr:DNA polymerase III subunit beta [Cyanobacteriota bacterium]
MKLKVPKTILDKAIKAVSKAVPSKGVQPILNNILLENSNGYLKLNATDLDFTIEAIIPSSNEIDGSITISARKLEEVVSKLEDDDVIITVDRETNKTNLLCRHSNFDLVGVASDDFPRIEKEESSSFVTINKDKLSRILDLVQFSASKYDLNNILGGVYLAIREDTESSETIFEFAATDGNRLSSYELVLEKDSSSSNFSRKEVVVPLRVISDVQKILETSVDEEIRISFLANKIVFFTQDRYIISRLLEGTYPRYKQLVPEGQDKIAQVNRKELISCLERVAVMANEITNLVKLSFKEGSLEIESSNQDFGKAADNIDIEYIGEPINIYFNVKYLVEPLKHINSENIQISMIGSLNPALIKPISDENYLHLIMPIKHESNA